MSEVIVSALKKIGWMSSALLLGTVVAGTLVTYFRVEGWLGSQFAPASLTERVVAVEVVAEEVVAWGNRVTTLSDSYTLAAVERAKNEVRFEDVNKRLSNIEARVMVADAEMRHVNTKLDEIVKVADRLLAIALRMPPGPAQVRPPSGPLPPLVPDREETAEEVAERLRELLRRYEENPPAPLPKDQRNKYVP